MSTITSTTDASALAKSIIQRFDTNSDGSLSSDEFSSFLTQLIGSVGSRQTAPTTAGSVNLSTLYPTASVQTETTPIADRQRVGKMEGFAYDKLRDSSHTSFKYQIGRILEVFPNTPAGLQEALPEIQKLVPGAKIIGTNGDKVDFGDYDDPKSGRIGVVDVLLSAGLGGRGWAWQPVESA